MGPEGQDKNQINLFDSEGSIVEYCSCLVSALDISGRVIESVKKEFFFEDGNEGMIELPPFLSKIILREQKDRYLPKDTLSWPVNFPATAATKQIFLKDTEASAKECVEIPDVDAATKREMLRYVYADSLNDLQWKNACNLYAVAVKYGICNLRDKCANFLKMNLCSKNACEALITSDLHQDVELKKSVQDHILNHVKEIIITDEWKDMMKTHSQLASETMYHRLLKDW
ncbi:TD and POZ domain-containing protein 5 [Caerostris extrusa]|uniref:TD and POZ domain-containing protein 5 n=1 Tax=Caerostris extrusa TaxID=172846 RepID=A0AAV4PD37_CAEEX|nr:TD and POZ domain-containing protein 5 [Caerostris extrusa]